MTQALPCPGVFVRTSRYIGDLYEFQARLMGLDQARDDFPRVKSEVYRLIGRNGDNRQQRAAKVNGGRIVRAYDYRDEAGELLFQVVRYDPKDFRQRRPDGKGGWIWKLGETRRVLYYLDELTRNPEATVHITEGEADADRLRAIGFEVITTNPGGTGKWQESYSQTLARRDCVLFYDNDPETIMWPGQLHAAHVARSLLGHGCTVRMVHLPTGSKDVGDFLDAGHTRDELIQLIDAGAPLTLASLAVWESQFAREKDAGPRKTQKLKKVITLPTLGLESFPFTDMGNGERMAHYHGDTMRHCHPWKQWLVWDGNRWAVDQRARVLVMAKELTREMFRRGGAIEDAILRDSFLDLARATEKAARTNSMLYFAAAQPGIPVMPDELDADPWLLNVENGTLNLKTGELREHNPDDLITKLAPVAYNPDAKCPQWERFQRQIMADDQDVIAFKQRAIGYSLTGLAVEKRALFIHHGKGNNGKSTEAETIRAMLGDYAGQIRVESLMEQRHRDGSAPSPDIADLRGLRYVTASEPKEGARLEESTVKYLTSMSRIKARQLHAGNFEFPQTWKLFLDCNEKPVITGTDDGIWSRIALIPYTVQVGDGCELPIDPDRPTSCAANCRAFWLGRSVAAWNGKTNG
jgi:putative DNA primase/helicase